MSYLGHVKNGLIVLDESVVLPDGAAVRVQLVPDEQDVVLDENGLTLGQKLLRHAGTVSGLPSDAARNLDRDLYGAPEQ